jgi:hypothetical protein
MLIQTRVTLRPPLDVLAKLFNILSATLCRLPSGLAGRAHVGILIQTDPFLFPAFDTLADSREIIRAFVFSKDRRRD